MSAISEALAARTQCTRGHEYTPENTRLRSDGSRTCRKCVQIRKRNSKPRKLRTKKLEQMSLTPLFQRAPGESERLYRRRRVERAMRFVLEQKKAPCVDCGGRFHYVAMDFDHLPGFEKRAPVSKLVSSGKSLKVITSEIAKCELVCSNCHRIRTHERERQGKDEATPPGRAPRDATP